MKIKKLLIFSIFIMIMIFNLSALAFAHPGHGSEYPEEVFSSSSSSHSSSHASTNSRSYSKSSSSQKSYSQQSSTTQSKSSSSSNSKSQSTDESNNQKVSTSQNNNSDAVEANNTNDTYNVEEVTSSNNSTSNQDTFFNFSNIILLIGAFVIGFGIIILLFKIKNN